ncbi:TPA: hypothetical protein ACYSCA_005128 [Klebsiella variicola]|nr:hypothetical protein [Klebsiella variicola]HED1713937.1 hypothetical protein [Klebsiella variicola subsp. variicola]
MLNVKYLGEITRNAANAMAYFAPKRLIKNRAAHIIPASINTGSEPR